MIKLKSKGTPGYINNRKLARGLLFLFEMILVIAVFVTGYITTKSRENLLTVVAIVGVLPMAKSLVAFIMIFPYHSQKKELYDEICQNAGSCKVLSELVITTSAKIMPIDFVVVWDGHILGYAPNPKCDIAFADKFLAENMQNNGHKASVKIMNDKNKFILRLKELSKRDIDDKQKKEDDAISDTVLSLAL